MRHWTGAKLVLVSSSQTSQQVWGFDQIDHSILVQELDKLQVHPALLSWISAFLFNRRQVVRIGSVLSSQWQTLKRGIPQGTKLGVVIFMVMTNSLLANWHLRTKFVDDTSGLEIIPIELSASLILQSLHDIHEFANEHNMKLNPRKCKEMLINFLHNPIFLLRPIQIGNNIIERVITYKSLSTNFKHKKSPNMSEIHGQNEARKPSLIANPLSSCMTMILIWDRTLIDLIYLMLLIAEQLKLNLFLHLNTLNMLRFLIYMIICK
jgi:hypothetical protein